MALATLSIDVVAKLAQLQTDMGAAARIVDKRNAEMERSLQSLRKTADNVGRSIGTGIAAYLTYDVFKQFIGGSVDALDALNDLKDATGASIENLSALEFVAMRNGATLEDVSSILVKFNGVLKEADGKNGVSQALEAIGLNADELRKKDPAQALTDVAIALQGFADDGTKARIVQDLFGKSVKDAAPFLKDLAEAGLSNATATTAQAEQAERFNKDLYELRTNASLLARSLVSELVPAMSQLIAKFNDQGFLALFGFDKKFDQTKGLAAKAKELTDAKRELDRVSGVGMNGALYDSAVLPSRKAADLAAATARFNKAKGDFRTANMQYQNDLNDERLGPLYAGYVPRRSQDLPAIKTPAASVATSLRNSSAKNPLEAIEKAEAKRQQDIKELEEKFQSVVADGDLKLADRANRYYEASLTNPEMLKADLEDINNLYELGAFGAVGSADALEKLRRATEAAKKSNDGLSDSYREVRDAIKNAVFEGGNLGDAIEQIAKKKLLIDPLTDAIDGMFSSLLSGASSSLLGGGGGGGSLLGGLGSLMGLFSGLGFADGGNPPVGKISMVGERGPELFMPKVPGTIIPNHMLGMQRGGTNRVVSITQHITIGDGVNAAQVGAAMNHVKQTTKAEIMQAIRRGDV